jgi:AcrR family transcriptional regulator
LFETIVWHRDQVVSDNDQTKSRLLEAAGEEFAEKGFEGATVRSICARAGVNLAAVNYHFGDKEQLYERAVVEAHRCGAEMMPEEEMFLGPPVAHLRRFIRHFLSNTLAIDRSGGWQNALMMREMLRPTSASQILVDEVIRPKFERLTRILRGIRPDLEGRTLVATGFSVIGQCLHYRMARPIAERLIGPEGFAELDLEFLTDHITHFTLRALDIDVCSEGNLV